MNRRVLYSAHIPYLSSDLLFRSDILLFWSKSKPFLIHPVQSPTFRSRSEDERSAFDAPGSSRTLRSATAAGGGGERPVVTDADLAGKTAEEREMMKMMGFCGFDTTKNKKVEGNASGEVHVILKRKYRQYMNRKGGFNRPLDFVA